MLLNPFRFAYPGPEVEDYPVVISAVSDSINVAASSHDIPLGTYDVGDMLLVFFAGRSDTANSAVPAGWSGTAGYSNTTPTPDGLSGCFYRVMDGTEGGSLTITLGGSQAITYSVHRIKAGTFESDPQFTVQLYAYGSTEATSNWGLNTLYLPYATATTIRHLSIYGLQSVTTYPEPTGISTDAQGTGVSTSTAKTYCNTKSNTLFSESLKVLPNWVFSASADYRETGVIVRGSRPLGHVDARIIRSWALTSASTNTTMVNPFNYCEVGDMIIMASRAEIGSMTSIVGPAFTQFYSSGLIQFWYKVLNESDLNSNLRVVYSNSGNHCGQLLRVRKGTFAVEAAPEMVNTKTASSTTCSTDSTALSADYAGKRNLAFWFESHNYSSNISYVISGTQTQYDFGPFQANTSSTNGAGCTGIWGTFDGASVPGESATLNRSTDWTTNMIVLKGLPIP